jgi:hypothetical protein
MTAKQRKGETEKGLLMITYDYHVDLAQMICNLER